MTRIRARSALAALSALVLLALVAAAGAPSAAPPQLRNGGTLTIGLAEDPDALDPTLARTFVGRIIFMHMCEKLYDLNSKLEIVPQLASALPTLSADKRTMTIPLRRNVRFNDGTAFDAAAVKKSLDRHRTLRGSVRASEISPVTSVETQGQFAVVLRLNDRYSPLTAQLADRAGMIMSPKALDELGDRFASNPVCVGPFMYRERQAGDHITLAKSPHYYARGRVRLDTLNFRIITDPSARSQNLRSGDIDVEDRIPSTELRGIASDRSLRVIKSTSIGYQGITLNIGNKNGLGKTYENVGTPIARTANLRHAFELALDRRVINRVVFGGTNQPDCFPWAPQSPWYAAVRGLPCHLTANMAEARRAFSRAGAQAPVKVRLMIGTDPIAARLGQVIQSMVRPVGFDVELQPTEFTTSLNRQDSGNYETFAIGWSGRIDPDGNFYQFVNSKGSQNTAGYSNPVVDRATNNARKAATQAARIASYRAAMRQVLTDLPLIYLWHPVNRFGVKQTVGGVQVYGDGLIRAQFAGFKR
jgi:peptide/nickel transport system substrate-binding protein